MYVIGVSVFAYERGGVSAVGIVALIRVLSGAFTAPFAAVLADRFRRERVMLFADISRALVLAAAVVVVSFDGPAAAVYGLAALVNALSTTFRPAQSALLPSIARTPEELTAANVTMSTIAAAIASHRDRRRPPASRRSRPGPGARAGSRSSGSVTTYATLASR